MKSKFLELKNKTENEGTVKKKPLWIKDNQLEQLENLKEEMVRIYKYHFFWNLY